MIEEDDRESWREAYIHEAAYTDELADDL